MTVKELIEKLSKLPSDYKVFMAKIGCDDEVINVYAPDWKPKTVRLD